MVRGNGRKKAAKKSVTALPFNTIGVRFLQGTAEKIRKVYTYKVRKGVKVMLGQELVADAPHGPVSVAVVRVDSKPQAPAEFVEQYGSVSEAIEYLKFIERKVVPL